MSPREDVSPASLPPETVAEVGLASAAIEAATGELSGESLRRSVQLLFFAYLEENPVYLEQLPHVRELHQLFREGLLVPPFQVHDIEAARSRARARQIWEQLAPLDHRAAAIEIATDETYATWGFCELLCDKSREAASQDPQHALVLAQMAQVVAGHIAARGGEPFPQCLPALRAYALAHQANAERVVGDLLQAQATLLEAHAQWSSPHSWDDDWFGYETRVRSFEVSLRRAQRRLPEALQALEQLERLQGEHPSRADGLEALRTRILKAKVLEELDRCDEAIQELQTALGTLASAQSEDGHLERICRHNLAGCYALAGRIADAETLLPGVRADLGEPASTPATTRFKWIEGHIALAKGKHRQAAKILAEVHQAFLDRDLAYDAALVSLELALAYAKDGKLAAVRRVAAQMLPIFQSQDLTRESLVALGLFQAAAYRDRINVQLVQEVHDFVRRARGNPELRWQPGPRS